MGFATGGAKGIEFEYEARSARFVRKVKSSSLWQIATGTVLAAAGAGGLGTSVSATLTERYCTGFRFAMASTIAPLIVDVTVGTSTVMSHVLNNNSANIAEGQTDMDAPFFVAGQFSTITVASRATSTTGGTVSVWMSGVIHPILTNIETK